MSSRLFTIFSYRIYYKNSYTASFNVWKHLNYNFVRLILLLLLFCVFSLIHLQRKCIEMIAKNYFTVRYFYITKRLMRICIIWKCCMCNNKLSFSPFIEWILLTCLMNLFNKGKHDVKKMIMIFRWKKKRSIRAAHTETKTLESHGTTKKCSAFILNLFLLFLLWPGIVYASHIIGAI